MIEIRNIMNRIDGINVPTNEMNELADDEKMEFTKILLDISAIKDRIKRLSMDDDAKKSAIQSLKNAEEALVALDETAVEEDEGSLTDQQKQGLQAIYKKYGNYEGYGNGDSLPIGNMEQVIDPGSTLWADDKEYKELDAYMKKMGYDGFEDAQDKDEDFFDNAMKEMPISSAMQDDISKVLGNDYYEKPDLAKAAKDYMSSSDESTPEDSGELARLKELSGIEEDAGLTDESEYEPFPEEDEMTFEDDDEFYEAFGELGFPEDETELFDAEYRGRKVPLNKPMRGDVKKFKVYVKDPKSGNVKKVNFGHGGSSARKAGQKTMKIRKSNPKARKSFRARHNCANPGPKTKARYWSCRKW